jgi:hypothetical protein
MASTEIGLNAIAANIAKGVADKAAGKSVTPPAKETVIIKNQEAGGVEVIDPNAGKEKYVVDGKERYLTPEEAKAYVQKGLAFEPKMDQLGRLQHETAQFLNTLQEDPGKVIYNERFGKPEEVLKKILGSTKISDEIKDTLGQWYYNNVIVPAQQTPEQRQATEWQRKAAAYEELQTQQAAAKVQAENDARVNQALQIIKAQINEAMSEAGVPLDSKIAPQLAKRVAQVMQLGYVNGKPVTPKEAMKRVRQELSEYQKAYYDVLDEDKLVEQLGKENAEKVRKYYLKAIKEAEKPKKDFKASPKREERKTMNSDEFRDYLDGLKKGK